MNLTPVMTVLIYLHRPLSVNTPAAGEAEICSKWRPCH